MAKLTPTFIIERWQPYNIKSYTKVTKKGTNSKHIQIKIRFCKPSVWPIVDEWTTIYTYHERWQTYKIASWTKATKQGPIPNMYQKNHMAFVNHMFDLLLTGQPTLTLLSERWQTLQHNIMHQNNPKKGKFQKCTKNNVTFVNYMFEPLLIAKLSTTLINERWQTYKDNILHQSNKNCLLIKW